MEPCRLQPRALLDWSVGSLTSGVFGGQQGAGDATFSSIPEAHKGKNCMIYQRVLFKTKEVKRLTELNWTL